MFVDSHCHLNFPQYADTLDALRAHRARYAAQPADATQLITFGESKPDASLPAPEVAAWTLTASLLHHLDETLHR